MCCCSEHFDLKISFWKTAGVDTVAVLQVTNSKLDWVWLFILVAKKLCQKEKPMQISWTLLVNIMLLSPYELKACFV